jgi:drug/metabolite transporter (DMT)-like permease
LRKAYWQITPVIKVAAGSVLFYDRWMSSPSNQPSSFRQPAGVQNFAPGKPGAVSDRENAKPRVYSKVVSGQPAIPLWGIHALMLIAAILVSSSFIVGEEVTHSLDPAVLTMIRFLLAVIFFAPYINWRYGLHLPHWRDLVRYGIISASIVGFFWCMFLALRYTSALNTSALFTLVPGISSLYGAVLLRERLGRVRLLALFCGLVGALWIIFSGDFTRLLALDFNKGDLIFLAGCLAMGFYTPLVVLLHRREPMPVMTFWVLVTGLGWLLVLALPGLATTPWSRMEPEIWAGIAYLAVFTTIITFSFTQVAILYLGSTRVMAYSYFYPALVLVLDWLLGRGLPPLRTVPGILIVLAAMLVLQRGVAATSGEKEMV